MFEMFRSASDTFLVESETRSTFDLQRRLRFLLGQELALLAQHDRAGVLRSHVGERRPVVTVPSV